MASKAKVVRVVVGKSAAASYLPTFCPAILTLMLRREIQACPRDVLRGGCFGV